MQLVSQREIEIEREKRHAVGIDPRAAETAHLFARLLPISAHSSRATGRKVTPTDGASPIIFFPPAAIDEIQQNRIRIPLYESETRLPFG